jgi:CO/xanthine dehydrogenase Mo-binding subunit
MPGMLNAVTYRTGIDKGILQTVKLPPETDKGYKIITNNDIPGKKNINFFGTSIPILADYEINFRGEPLYIIVYDSEENHKTALDGIIPGIKAKPPLSFEKDKLEENQIVYQKFFSFGSGSSDPLFNDELESYTAIIPVTDNFHSSEYHSRYCEPFGAIAQPDKNGITIYTVSQWPEHVRKSVADALNISQKNVKVIITALSTPLEGRIWYPSLISSQAAVAAHITGKPVKLILSKYETYNFTPRQHPFRITHKTWVSKGKLLKMHINLDIDAGAYPLIIEELFEKTFIQASGLYECNDITMKLRLIQTSKPPMSFISGINFSQIMISLEKHISNIIRQEKISPVTWRKENILSDSIKKNSLFIIPGDDIKSINSNRNSASAILENVSKASDFERKYASFELLRLNKHKNIKTHSSGIGLALSFFNNTIPFKSMIKDKLSLKLLLDSKSYLNIYTSTVPDGIHNYDIWKNTAGEILGIPTDNIFILPHQTDLAPPSAAYPFSKGLAGFTELLKNGCQSLQKKRFRNPLPIEITASLSLNKLSKDDYAWGSAVVELSIDNHTYEIEIKKITCCFDCGHIMHKEIIDKTVYSGIIDSLSWISGAENMSTDKNRLIQNDNIRHFLNIPIYTEYINNTKKNKSISIGDLPLSLIAGAYYSALIQALGVDIDRMPVTPENIHDILYKNRSK